MKNKIVIFILVVAICGLSIYGLVSYFDYVSNKSEDNKKEIWEKLDVNDSIVKDLFAMTGSSKKNLFVDTDYENIYFSGTKTKIKTMDIEFKLLLVLYNLDQDNFVQEENVTKIEEKYIKEKYNEIFGDNDYEARDFFAGCPSQIKYNKEQMQYEYDEYCGGMQVSGYEYKLIEARKYTDRIEIYNKVAFYLIDENEETISYWKNSDISSSIITLSLDQTFNIDEYLETLNTYKYTFRLKGEKYYFEMVEKLK